MIKGKKFLSILLVIALILCSLVASLSVSAANFDTEYVMANGEETVTDLLGGVKLHTQDIKALKDCNGTYYYNYDSQYLETLPGGEGVKFVSWSYRSADAWQMAGVSDIAKNFEENNPGWLVVGGTNADFFHINGNGQMADNAMEQGEMLNAYQTNVNEWWRGILGFTADNELKVGIPTITSYYTAHIYDDSEYENEIKGIQVNGFNPSTISDTGITVITKDATKLYDLTGYKVMVGKYEINRKTSQNTYFIKGQTLSLREGTTDELPQLTSEDGYETLREFYLVAKDDSLDNIPLNTYIRIQKDYTGEWADVENSASYYWKILDNGEVMFQNHSDTEIAAQLKEKYNLSSGGDWSYITTTKSRCLFGIKPDGSYVMAVVGGTSSSGMTLSEAAYYMKATGCIDAWDFDGGGSATLIARDADGIIRTINTPSDAGDGTERRVGNALLMVVRDPGFTCYKKDSTCTTVTFNKKSDEEFKKMSNISITIDGKTYEVLDNQESITIGGLAENTSYNALINYTFEEKEYQTTMVVSTREFKSGLSIIPNTYSFTVKRNATDAVLKAVGVTFTVDSMTYTMGDVDEFVIDGLVKNKSYRISYVVTILNTLTNETFTKDFDVETYNTLDYEVPEIIKFVESRITNDKIVIEYKYEDVDGLITSAYILVNGQKHALTNNSGRYTEENVDRNLYSYSFKLVLEYTDPYDRPLTISSEEILYDKVHVHSWVDATCENSKICSTCGETEGEALGHTWVDATCDTAKTCSMCGKSEGEPLGHTWAPATTDAPKTCSVCGETEGEKLPSLSDTNEDESDKKGCSCKKSSLAKVILSVTILAGGLILFRKKK